MGVNGLAECHPAISGQALSECRPLRGRPRAGRVDFPSMSALPRALHAGLLENVDRHHRVEGGRENACRATVAGVLGTSSNRLGSCNAACGRYRHRQ